MEEITWLIFGALAIVVSIALITRLVQTNAEDNKTQELENTLQLLKNQCNLVCELGQDTMLSIDVAIPSNSLIYKYNKTMCYNYLEDKNCARCNCNITNTDNIILNLTFEESGRMFEIHDYACFFTKTGIQGVKIDCKG